MFLVHADRYFEPELSCTLFNRFAAQPPLWIDAILTVSSTQHSRATFSVESFVAYLFRGSLIALAPQNAPGLTAR